MFEYKIKSLYNGRYGLTETVRTEICMKITTIKLIYFIGFYPKITNIFILLRIGN
jgi:hypothetical protein